MVRYRLAVTALALAFGASLTTNCGDRTTRIELRVRTDLPCEYVRGVSVTAGQRGQIEGQKPAYYSFTCSLDGTVGSFPIIPVSEYVDNFEVRAVLAVIDDNGGGPQKPDDCNAENGYAGCVVARRTFGPLPEETIYVEVPVLYRCRDVEAGCGAELTCVERSCVSAFIADPSVCRSRDVCNDSVLPGGDPGQGGAGGNAGAGQGGGGQGGAGQSGGGQGGGGQGGGGQGGDGQGGGGQGGGGQGGGGQGGGGQGGGGQGGSGLGGLGGVLLGP